MEEAGKEVKMSQAERERQAVGLTPEEVRELNTLKPKKDKDMTRRDLVKKVGNVLTTFLTTTRT